MSSIDLIADYLLSVKENNLTLTLSESNRIRIEIFSFVLVFDYLVRLFSEVIHNEVLWPRLF